MIFIPIAIVLFICLFVTMVVILNKKRFVADNVSNKLRQITPVVAQV